MAATTTIRLMRAASLPSFSRALVLPPGAEAEAGVSTGT